PVLRLDVRPVAGSLHPHAGVGIHVAVLDGVGTGRYVDVGAGGCGGYGGLEVGVVAVAGLIDHDERSAASRCGGLRAEESRGTCPCRDCQRTAVEAGPPRQTVVGFDAGVLRTLGVGHGPCSSFPGSVELSSRPRIQRGEPSLAMLWPRTPFVDTGRPVARLAAETPRRG